MYPCVITSQWYAVESNFSVITDCHNDLMNSVILEQDLIRNKYKPGLLLTAPLPGLQHNACIRNSVYEHQLQCYIHRVCCTYASIYIIQHCATAFQCYIRMYSCINTAQVCYSYMYSAYGTCTRICINTVECTI